MSIRITINGKPASADRGKDELEGMLANSKREGLTRSVLNALIAEIDNSLPWPWQRTASSLNEPRYSPKAKAPWQAN